MLKRLILTLNILFLTSIVLANRTYATPLRWNVPEQTKLDFTKKSTGVNLETTATASNLMGFVSTMSNIVFGGPMEHAYKCGAPIVAEVVSKTGSGSLEIEEGGTVEDPTICEDMGIISKQSAYNTRPKGNLLGLVSSMERAIKDPIPVNLAYYVNQNAQKIPGLKNTVLAQDTVEYGGPFLGAIYHYWTISRNVAYAFLAAAMTVIGVMIIMGKSIDPKAGVTVQQALPQIIIALVLITFSYPIGAAGASLAYNIKGSLDSSSLISDANNFDPTALSSSLGYGVDSSFVILTIVSLFVPGAGLVVGAGYLILVMGLISAVIALIMGLLVLLKIFGIYLKMLFAILSAPVSFAIGAMPGNSDTTMNWFKQYGAYIVSIPVMSFAAWFVFYLSIDIGAKALVSFEEFGGWQFGRLAGVALPAITAFGYNLVLTIPEKVEGMFGIKNR